MGTFSFQNKVKAAVTVLLASLALVSVLLMLNNADIVHATGPIEENPVSTGDASE